MQLTYSQYNDELQLGNIADTSLRQIDSGLAQGAVGIGKPVVRGTDKLRQYVAAGSGVGQGALIVGISVLSQSVEQALSTGVVQYADKEMFPLLRKGRVVVETDDAVVAGAVANYKLSNSKWTDEAVATGIEAVALISARFITGTSAAGLAIIEIDNK